ncbi:MAG: response regulator transcription factor [Nitrospirae bacterium]|nr:response regulator transcription factor [Nitrospirota bacterium]
MSLSCPKCQTVLDTPLDLQHGVEEFLCTQCHTLLKLTMAVSMVNPADEEDAGPPKSSTPSPKVVAVFPGKASLEIVKELLTAAHIDVATSETGRETLTLVDQLQPNVVIVDDALPDLSGMDVCELLKRSKRHHGLKVLLVTNWQNRGNEVEETSMLYGPDAMLPHAMLYRELVKRVQALIEQAPQTRNAPPASGFDPDATRLMNNQRDSRSSRGR